MERIQDQRQPRLATRTTPEVKSAFGTLATSQGMTESALLQALVAVVLRDNNAVKKERGVDSDVDSRCVDRVTLRLRPSDRHQAEQRARLRGLPLSRYLVLLIQAHLRCDPPMPAREINDLKAAVNQLTVTNRALVEFARRVTADPCAVDFLCDLQRIQQNVQDLRTSVTALAKANLKSWEGSREQT